MLENIALSFQGIWNHKMRSFLTMLGIIIGIASIITIVSTIKGTNEQIKENLIGSGTNIVTVSPQAVDGYLDLEYSEPPEGILAIDSEVQEELNEQNCVEETALYCCRSWADNCYYQNTAFSGAVAGVDIHYFSVADYRVNYGRLFVESDYTENRKVCVLDSKSAGMFNGTDPIGQTIELNGEPFTVVGIAEKRNAGSVTINSYEDYITYADTSSGTVFIPLDTWPIVYRYDEPQTVAVRATSTDDMATAGTNVAKVLNEKCITDENYTYEADNLMEQASDLQSLASSTSSQLIWIAGISLLVGGIGVMNIMLVSVTERTKEIGLKMAIGARRRRILGQFLTEAGALTFLGGVLGVIFGIIMAQLLSHVMGTPVAISIPACIIAVLFSMLIGVVFGLIPAVKASKLSPIEALRRD